jgi:flagellar biosynthesis anti-sigma factor FlgM
MRIDDKNAAGLGAGGVEQARAAEAVAKRGAAPGTARSGGGSGDEVSLSGLAEQIHAQEAHSPARQARLERLAERVALGSYEPDPEAVAEGLISEAGARE